MGPTRSKIKNSTMKSTKGESKLYTCAAVLGICLSCLPWLAAASQQPQKTIVRPTGPKLGFDGDLQASESQNVGNVHRTQSQMPAAPVAVPTSPVPVAVAPPPNSPTGVAAPPAGFTIPKTDLASAPSYAPRYTVPSVSPWKERLPFEVQQFRRRATDDDGYQPEDDYQPQESKGKKHSPGVIKRVTKGIRNTGKAIVGAPSYILKRYRGTWKKYFGGGGKKKKGGWKAWSSSSYTDKNDGWAGWEESEPTGGYYDEPSHYEKGWKGKGYSKGYDSHERRDRDRGESSSYRDYRDRDTTRDYDNPPSRSPPPKYRSDRERDRPKSSGGYREETHYDDYDGRRTTAYYGPTNRKSPSKRPSSSSGNYRYDDDY